MAEKATEGTTQQATANGAAKPGKKTINKLEAVRRSIEKLGGEATLSEIQADVKKRFGHDMTTNHISTYRGDLRRKAAAQGSQKQSAKVAVRSEEAATPKTAPKPAAPAPAASKNSKGTTPAAKNGKAPSIPLDDIVAIKELVGRVGAGNLKKLIDVMDG